MGEGSDTPDGACIPAASVPGDGAQPTADLVGKVDMMLRQLFDIVYVPEAVLREAAVAASTCAAAAAAAAASVSTEAPEGAEKAPNAKAKGKAAAPAAPPPQDAPPDAAAAPPPPAPESVWQQRQRLISQQARTASASFTQAEAGLLRSYSFLKAPPPHLKQLVKAFLLSLGAFEYHLGRPDPEKATPAFSRQGITVQEARQICMSRHDVRGFSYAGKALPSGAVDIDFYLAAAPGEEGICKEIILPDGQTPAPPVGGSEEECEAPPCGSQHPCHTYLAFPSVAGEYTLREGPPLQEYSTVSSVALHQSGPRVWGTQTRPGRRTKFFVKGTVTPERGICLTVSDDRGMEVPGLAECFCDDNVYTVSGVASDPPEASVVTEFAGGCNRTKDIQGSTHSWEFRLERDCLPEGSAVSDPRRATQQEQAPQEATHVSELHQNTQGIVSVRFTVQPPVTSHMQKEPAGEKSDFRRIFLNKDLTVIYGVDGWMSGMTSMADEDIHPGLEGLLLDLPTLAGVRTAEVGGAGGTLGTTERSALTLGDVELESLQSEGTQGAVGKGGSASGMSCPQQQQQQTALAAAKRRVGGKGVPEKTAVLSSEDLAVVAKMNSMQHFTVNPRGLPPDALQPPHELALSQGLPAWKAKTVTAGQGGGETLKVRKTLTMNTSLPKGSVNAAGADRIFAACPAALHFKPTFAVGETYELFFTLTNKDKVSRRCRAIPPSDPPCFAVSLLTEPPANGLLAPGMSLKYSVRFTPEKLETARASIVVATEWSDFAIPVTAVREAPVLWVNGSEMPPPGSSASAAVPEVFLAQGDCLIGGSRECTFTLQNTGGWASFAVTHGAGAARHAVEISPEVVSLGRGESAEVSIKVTPSVTGDATVSLAVDSDEGGAAAAVTIATTAVYPRLGIPTFEGMDLGEELPLEFGEISLLSTASKPFVVRNEAAVALSCCFHFASFDAFGTPLATPAHTVVPLVDGDASSGNTGHPPRRRAPLASGERFAIPPQCTASFLLSFTPADEGLCDGLIQLALCDIPAPEGPDHPFFGKSVEVPCEGGGVHEGYLVAAARLSGFGSKVRLEVEPGVIEPQAPVQMHGTTTRRVTLWNRGTRDVAFQLDAPLEGSPHPDEASAVRQKQLHRATGSSGPLDITELARGVTLQFNPQSGVVPAGQSVAVSVSYTPLCLGGFYARADVLFDGDLPDTSQHQRVPLEVMGEAFAPRLRCDDTRIAFTTDGPLSTAAHGGRGVSKTLTVANTSDVVLALHAYCYADMMRIHSAAEAAAEEGQGDPDATRRILQGVHPLYQIEPDVDLILPGEEKLLCVTLFPPGEPCAMEHEMSVVAAPLLPQHGKLVDQLELSDLFEVRDRGDMGLLEAISILLGCTPPVADTLLSVMDVDPAAALHHVKLVNTSRKGLDLMTSYSAAQSSYRAHPPSHAGLLHSVMLTRMLESPALLGRLEAALRTSVSPDTCRILTWARHSLSFIKCLHSSRLTVAMHSEVQTVRCRVTPSLVSLAGAVKDVRQPVDVVLKNVTGVDGMFLWATLDADGGENVVATVEPCKGVIPAGASVKCRIGVTQKTTDPMDFILPCIIRNLPVPGVPAMEEGKPLGDECIVGVHLTSCETQSLSLSLEASGAPVSTEAFCRHLLENVVGAAVGEPPRPLIPELRFENVGLFDTRTAHLVLQHHQGGDVDYSLSVERFRPADPSSWLRNSAKLLMQRGGSSGSFGTTQGGGDDCLTVASGKSSGGHSKKSGRRNDRQQGKSLALSKSDARFTSGNGRRLAAEKQKKHELRDHSYDLLSHGLGFAIDLPNPTGSLSRTGAAATVVPVEIHADLPGRYEDRIHLSVSDSEVPPVLIPVTCTVTGQLLNLSENTPGMSFLQDGPPVLSFPVHLASPTMSRTKYFRVENPGRVDVDLAWSLQIGQDACEAHISDTGDVTLGEVPAQEGAGGTPPFHISVVPPTCVVPAGKSTSFQVVVVMKQAGAYTATMLCKTRTAATAANVQYLRSAGMHGTTPPHDAGLSDDEVMQQRWAQEEAYAIPLHIDVRCAAVGNGLQCDPTLLQLVCRGAPGPFDAKGDGFCKTLRLSNPVAAPQDFRVLCEPPFILAGFALHRAGEQLPLVGGRGDRDGVTLFQLKSAEALDLTVQLPWGEEAAHAYYSGLVVGDAAMSLSGSGAALSLRNLPGDGADLMTMRSKKDVQAGSRQQHHRRGRVQTQDIARLESAITLKFANGDEQSVPVLAVVHYPAVTCEPLSLTFGVRPEDRKAEWSKRLFLEAATAADVHFRVVHKAKQRPITKISSKAARKEDIKNVLQRETTKQLQASALRKPTPPDEQAAGAAEGAAPIDDPDAFSFDTTQGTVAGQSAERSIATIRVNFHPRGTAVFESAYTIEVEGGRGCEFTLRGHSAEAEYGHVTAALTKQ